MPVLRLVLLLVTVLPSHLMLQSNNSSTVFSVVQSDVTARAKSGGFCHDSTAQGANAWPEDFTILGSLAQNETAVSDRLNVDGVLVQYMILSSKAFLHTMNLELAGTCIPPLPTYITVTR